MGLDVDVYAPLDICSKAEWVGEMQVADREIGEAHGKIPEDFLGGLSWRYTAGSLKTLSNLFLTQRQGFDKEKIGHVSNSFPSCPTYSRPLLSKRAPEKS